MPLKGSVRGALSIREVGGEGCPKKDNCKVYLHACRRDFTAHELYALREVIEEAKSTASGERTGLVVDVAEENSSAER